MAAPNFDTVGQIFQCRLVGYLYSQTCITSFDYQATAVTGTGVTPSEAITSLIPRVWDGGTGIGLRAVTTSDYNRVFLQGQVIAPTRYVVTNVNPTNTDGSVTQDALPPANAVVVQKLSTLAGRKHRGRWFLPGIPQGYSAQGVLTATAAGLYVTATQFWFQAFVMTGAGGSVSVQPVIYNLRAPANMTPIAGRAVDGTLRVQRRREVGRGV